MDIGITIIPSPEIRAVPVAQQAVDAREKTIQVVNLYGSRLHIGLVYSEKKIQETPR
jgi:hypothetical protein